MLDKHEIASALRETGLLLKVKGENAFKAKAYVTAARALEAIKDDLGSLIEQQRLTDIPGIGKSLAGYITEIFNTGDAKMLNQLREELPPGTAELSQIDGLTLKRIQKLHAELNIQSLVELEAACREGKVAGLKGFGVKLQNDILQSIASIGQQVDKIRLVNAMDAADELVEFIKGASKTDHVETAGAVRRWCETVDRITIVAEGNQPDIAKFMSNFHDAISVDETDQSVLVLLSNGMTVEIFAVSSLPLGMVAHTGTPVHFEKLKEVALAKGFELSPNYLRKGSKDVEIPSEDKFFETIGLHPIPVELREGEDEVGIARTNDFLGLVDMEDIRGMTHCHSTFSDGVHSIEQMARAAKKLGMDYITITDHSPTAHYAGGLSIDRLKEQWAEIDEAQETVGIKILKGTECDILADGTLDYPDHILEQFDIIIASIHSRYRQTEEQMTARLLNGLRNPHFKIWGHPLGRLVLSRDPIPCDVTKVLEAIADARVAIEINGDPYRMDLAPNWSKVAKSLGLKFVISTDAHSINNLYNLPFGIHMARRARLLKEDVLNTLPFEQFKDAVKTACRG